MFRRERKFLQILQVTMNNNHNERIKASFQLFDRMKRCFADLKVDFDNDTALALIEVD
jgi:Ca2+-binding EF-hand superfamily protein